ncbi:MAG: D-alanine--D-alanine ligase [Phycisphaeraceae bacterium]
MPPSDTPLRILVLAGGPDRERDVSLASGQQVTDALTEAGHDVRQRDIAPDDLAALDEFADWPGDVIFPALHGRWGEGGGLQSILDERGLPYVGSRAPAAALCMDKHLTKQLLARHDIPTPEHELLEPDQPPTIGPPAVLKPVDEGSSIGMAICHDAAELEAARRELAPQYPSLMLERYVTGMEITVSVLETPGTYGPEPLPPIHVVPATAFYDYDAKYERDDTQYHFDIDLPGLVLAEIQRLALVVCELVEARHLARVDFIVDERQQPWILEINTMPGLTSHSLLPKAAAHAGLDMPAMTDRLARLAQ